MHIYRVMYEDIDGISYFDGVYDMAMVRGEKKFMIFFNPYTNSRLLVSPEDIKRIDVQEVREMKTIEVFTKEGSVEYYVDVVHVRETKTHLRMAIAWGGEQTATEEVPLANIKKWKIEEY